MKRLVQTASEYYFNDGKATDVAEGVLDLRRRGPAPGVIDMRRKGPAPGVLDMRLNAPMPGVIDMRGPNKPNNMYDIMKGR